uniref:Amino acid transporter transmembrane domain-containing protein n=1 Tax=Salix viminalis TaxID=40686 RepID=A0A6N2LVL9_SALVM
MCQFPLAIAGFWAYGNKIPSNGGMLTAFFQFHGHDTSKSVKGLVYLLVVIHCLSSFQIYAMPVFDNLEFRYVSMKNRRCPWWVRFGFRLFFGGLAFFIAVALPFLAETSSFNWRDHAALNTGLSMFHVDLDQETPSERSRCRVVS